MKDREFVASPPDGGKDPADFARLKVSSNKANGNMLADNFRRFMFCGHDGFFFGQWFRTFW
jgi:hypothetical protein